MEWKNKFPESSLEAGKALYDEGKVTGLTKIRKGYEAFVCDFDGTYNAGIGLSSGRITSMFCACSEPGQPVWCRHIAALLFAVEQTQDSKMLSDSSDEDDEAHYTYFQMDKIKSSLNFSDPVLEEGRILADDGKISLKSVETGYTNYSDEMMATATGIVKKKNEQGIVKMTFGPGYVEGKNCTCKECSARYSYWYSGKKTCAHLAGLCLLLEDYMKDHEIGDDTDKNADSLIAGYQDLMYCDRKSGYRDRTGYLEIKPRLVNKSGKFSVDFRIGETGGKMFVIKKLTEFSGLVKEGGDSTYGASTVINHDIRNFTDQSKKFISFIEDVAQIESEFADRDMVTAYFHRMVSGEIGQQISLSGKKMDNFFDITGSQAVDYEIRSDKEKKKGTLTCCVQNPQITMVIDRIRERPGIFQGIEVEAQMPAIIRGFDYTYFISEDKLCRMEDQFTRKMMPMFALMHKDRVEFRVGRLQLQSFYYTVLPQLRDIIDVEVHDEEIIAQHLLPEVKFIFYLDVENRDVICRAHSLYGEQEFSLMIPPKAGRSEQRLRDQFREEEALEAVKKYFPCYDNEKDEFFCNQDENIIYGLLSEGISELMEYGEVQSTDSFDRITLSRRPNLSIGVSVQSGLLDLEISSDDISAEELLDVLASYKRKKKFHRLRNGNFLSLEDDAYKMLDEMIETLRISPKEFVSGKMHIPAYRALYLDKMMEEHDQIYAERDSHFRKLVRDFHSVQDTDYQIPESLQKILRNYQKTGYKWLRTLESGHFGGILADDMGLGKTLQIIAVLLAHKEEGKKGTSLVVCPASLVYNWGEEIERYAPSLLVCFVTGTQEERRSKISLYSSYDVLITSYDLLKRDIDNYDGITFDCEVIDEAQFIKNHTTAAAKAVKLIKSENRFALTGTPIENRLSELWSIFDFLMPGFLYRYDEFKKSFETRIVKDHDEEISMRLRRLVSPFILRRLKQDVLKDLPDKIEETRYVTFGEKQQKLYDAQVVYMRQKIARQDNSEFAKTKFEIFRELTKLRQICCDPSLCFEDYDGGSAKLESCLDLVESAIDGGHRILLFSQFTSMLSRIREAFDERKISYYEITGSTPKEKRLSLVKQFNKDDVQVFLISLKAGGTGLNLTGADVVVHFDPWWNVAVQNQATDRAHRIGQEKIVTVYKMIMKNSIEEKIQKMQENKQNLADQIISGEMSGLTDMTKEELLDLLS